jgi:hypothetical protein
VIVDTSALIAITFRDNVTKTGTDDRCRRRQTECKFVNRRFPGAHWSWHVQDKSLINGSQIVWIGRDHVQVALPCADSNRNVDDVSVT